LTEESNKLYIPDSYLSIWHFLSLLKYSCFYRISRFIAVLTKPGDLSFLFYWKKLKILPKFLSLKSILILLSSKSISMSIFLKIFLPCLSPFLIFYYK